MEGQESEQFAPCNSGGKGLHSELCLTERQIPNQPGQLLCLKSDPPLIFQVALTGTGQEEADCPSMLIDVTNT